MLSALVTYRILIVGVSGLVLSFTLGLSRMQRKDFTPWAVLIGTIVNLATQLPEGGLGLCVGIVVLPIECLVIAFVGRGARVLLIWAGVINEPPKPIGPLCPSCGYCLLGLTEHICPECGRPFTFEELGISPRELQPPEPKGDASGNE
jgi:hypothetical protein